MKEPIFIYCPNTLDVFESVEFAAGYIEAPEVKSDDHNFYDSEGQVLEAIVVIDQRGIENCVIRETAEKKYQPEILKTLLFDMLRYLGRIKKIPQYSRKLLMQMSLQELVVESLKFKIR